MHPEPIHQKLKLTVVAADDFSHAPTYHPQRRLAVIGIHLLLDFIPQNCLASAGSGSQFTF